MWKSEKFAVLLAVLAFVLAGCSSGDAGSPEQEEIAQLREENERLREDLEEVIADLQTAEQRIDDLGSEISAAWEELAAMQESQAEQPEPAVSPASAPAEIVPPKSEPDKMLLGEWFFSDFQQQTEVDNWTQSLVFRADGTGTIFRTFYLPSYLNSENYSTSDPTSEVSLGFSWTLSGDALHTEYEGGGGFVDYTFSAEQQELQIQNENGSAVSNMLIYKRERPSIPEGYVEKNVIINNMQAQQASLMRRFLGNWYFDVLTWTFNEDGTGMIDIPELGQQPASVREFTYKVSNNGSNLMMTVEWSDSQTSFFWPTINADGSITLRGSSEADTLTLTRTFDIENCPLTEEIISNAVGAITGSMFSEILPDYIQ